jgi:hypothetical protein
MLAQFQGFSENLLESESPAFFKLPQTLSDFPHQGAIAHDRSCLAPPFIFVRAQKNSRRPAISSNDKLFLVFFALSHQLAQASFGF